MMIFTDFKTILGPTPKEVENIKGPGFEFCGEPHLTFTGNIPLSHLMNENGKMNDDEIAKKVGEQFVIQFNESKKK